MIAAALTAGALAAAPLADATTTRVNVDSRGVETLTNASEPAGISADGRLVVFTSRSANLVPGDTNGRLDVFVHDRETRRMRRVSVRSDGRQARGASGDATISADGRFVAFTSNARNLVRGDTNRVSDVFVHDLRTRRTTRVSVSSRGRQAARGGFDLGSEGASLSADGRYVAFESYAPNLTPDDEPDAFDVFLRDRRARRTIRLSSGVFGGRGHDGAWTPSLSADGRVVAFEARSRPRREEQFVNVFVLDRRTGRTREIGSAGGDPRLDESGEAALSADGRSVAFTRFTRSDDFDLPSAVHLHKLATGASTTLSVNVAGAVTGESNSPSISGDGRFVAFGSYARDLVPDDRNRRGDVFVHDREDGTLTRVSVAPGDEEARGESSGQYLSADGRWLAFGSGAANLVAGDANGAWDVFVRGPLR